MVGCYKSSLKLPLRGEELDNADIELFSEPSEPREGAHADEGQLIEQVAQRYPGKAYCLVRDWTLFRAELTEAELAKVAAAGNIPLFLLAHNVVADSAGRFQPGNWLRSSIGVALVDGYFLRLETRFMCSSGKGLSRRPRSRRFFHFIDVNEPRLAVELSD